jgi:hypothetical protein
MESHGWILELGMYVTAATYFLLLILTIVMYASLDDFIGAEILITRIFAMVIVAMTFLLVRKFTYHPLYSPLISLAFSSITILGFMNIIYPSELPEDVVTIEMFLNLAMIVHVTGILFQWVVLNCSVLFVLWVILVGIYWGDAFEVVGHAIFVVAFLLLSHVALYYKERNQRIVSNLQKVAEREIHQTEDLIT